MTGVLLQTRAVKEPIWGELSSPDVHLVTSETAPGYPVSAVGPDEARHVRGLRPGAGATRIPPAGHPDHGLTAILRRQPVRMVDGRAEGGYTDVFELICPDCGDHPGLDYSEVLPRVKWLRGPRTLEAAVAEYARHTGLT